MACSVLAGKRASPNQSQKLKKKKKSGLLQVLSESVDSYEWWAMYSWVTRSAGIICVNFEFDLCVKEINGIRRFERRDRS